MPAKNPKDLARAKRMKTAIGSDGLPKNIDEIRQKAQETNDPQAHTDLGIALYSSGKRSLANESIEHLEIGAEAGIADAIAYLGDAYFMGSGVKTDKAKGIEYYEKAAKLGHVEASFSAGNEYMYDKNVDADYEKAREYLSYAAERKSPRGCNSLGIMYMCGYGVEKDLDEARRLFKKAQTLGHVSARSNIKLISELGEDFDYAELIRKQME